jgi:Raf kinase inhibitor-like YbhB/YbcL family protein
MVARAREFAATTVALLLLASGCGQDEEVAQPDMDEPQTITVTSTAFADGERIPARYTCDDANVSPPLEWEGVPADAQSVALVFDDPDAPNGTFTHWVVLDLAADVSRSDEDSVPAGGVQAQNSARRASYFGPCPPSGTHRYRFTVYALSSPTGLADGASLSDALPAIEERAVAWGRLTGVYSRS